MANVSSSNGLEKRPKLRFPGFDEPWKVFKAEELFQNITDKNHPDETVLTIIQGKGTLPREQAGRNIHYDDASLSNYKKVEQGDFIIHLRSFEGGLEMANEAGIVSPAYTILRCKRPHSSLFYDAYFHTDEFINHNLSKSVEGIRDGRQISYEAFKWLGIPYCEPTEQEKISNLFAALNERIAKQRDLVESLKKYKRGLLMHFFSDETTRQWRQYTISQIGKVITGSTPPTNDRSNYDGDLMFCSPGDIGEQKYISSTEKRVSPKGFALGRPIPPSSVIVTCIGLIGKLGIATSDMITNQQINALIVSGDFDHEFIYYAFENFFPKYRSKVSMQTLPILSKSEFERLLIKVPNLNVQRKISNYLAGMDKRIEQTQQELNMLQELRRGIIQKLFI